MLFGTTVWYGDRPFDAAVRRLYEAGFDYFELALDYPLPECMSAAARASLRSLLRDLGMGVAFHAPLDVFIAQPRPEIFEASLKIMRRCVDFAAAFEPLYFNFHTTFRVSTHAFEDVRRKIEENGLRACREIAGLCERLGFPACVENVFVPLEDARLLAEALALENLWLTFDVGHAIIAEATHEKWSVARRDGSAAATGTTARGGAGGRGAGRRGAVTATAHAGGGDLTGGLREKAMMYIEAWLSRFGDKILVVHLHDCAVVGGGFERGVPSVDVRLQDHILLGRGELDIPRILERFSVEGVGEYMLIETFWRDKHRLAEVDYRDLHENLALVRQAYKAKG
ncbi:MAG: sugar phosphate isomerase/epimerase family protein [Candidatus Alkanophagales archaeon]